MIRDRCARNDDGKTQQPLKAIKICRKTNEERNTFEYELEKSKKSIARLSDDISSRNNLIREYKTLCQMYSDKFDEQEQISVDKETKIRAMQNDLTVLVDELKRVNQKNARLERYWRSSIGLIAKTPELEEQYESLKNKMDDQDFRCLRKTIDENKCLSGKIAEKNRVIEYMTECNERLNYTLLTQGKKLEEADVSKVNCNYNHDDLIEKNAQPTCSTKIRDDTNRGQKSTIERLREIVEKLTVVLRDCVSQKELYEKNIDCFNEDKCDIERKLNTEIDGLARCNKTINSLLAIKKSEITFIQDRLKRKEDENKILKKDVESFECTIREREEQIKNCKDTCVELERTKLVNELEIKTLKGQERLLKNKIHEAAKENEKQMERMLQLSENTNSLRNELEIVESENFELANSLRRLEEENRTLMVQINDLNSSLDRMKRNENEGQAKILACKNEVSMVTENLCAREMNRLKKELEESRENLCCTESNLKNGLIKPDEATVKKDSIHEMYCKLNEECMCERKMCSDADNVEKPPENAFVRQTETTGEQSGSKIVKNYEKLRADIVR